MKKTLSFLLTAAMLLAMFSALAVTPVNAAEAAQPVAADQPLEVSFVGGSLEQVITTGKTQSDTLGQYFYGWDPIFDYNNTSTRVTPFIQQGEYIEVIGEFSEAASISSVVFRTVGGNRLKGNQVSFSADGKTWVSVLDIQDSTDPKNSDVTFAVADTTAYRYVKLYKDGSSGNNETQGSGNNGCYLDINHVRFYTGSETTPLTVNLISGKAYLVSDNDNEFVPGSQVPSNNAMGKFYSNADCLFDPTNSTTRVTPNIAKGKTAEFVGKLTTPSPITKIVIQPLHSNVASTRLNGVVVAFSQDGVHWDKGITIQRPDGGLYEAVEIPVIGDSTVYRYVKVLKCGNAADCYMDVYNVCFYSDTSEEKLIEANYDKTLTTATTTNLNKFFDFGNRDKCLVEGNLKPDDLAIARFDHPTVLTDVYVDYHGVSGNWTKVLASVDGETWTQVAQMTGIFGNVGNTAGETIVHLVVADTTAYNYVKIERNHDYGSGWQAYSIGFLGTEQEANNGFAYQTKVESEEWSLRLIAAVDALDFEVAGFEIVATAAEIDPAKEWDRNTTVVYSGVYELPEGEEDPILRDASYFGGTYLCTAVISGISIEDYSEITFTVKPYVVVDGNRVYSAPHTFALNDGVPVTE